MRKFENVLAKVEYQIKDANVVTALISLLDDDAEFQELMFSIIHGAKTSDAETIHM